MVCYFFSTTIGYMKIYYNLCIKSKKLRIQELNVKGGLC